MILANADSIKVGSSNADKVYVGSNLVYPTSVLQQFPNAEVAFSLRQLTNNNLDVVRVKRPNGDETNFKATDLTDGTLEAYVGAGNDGYITKWYDQSGNDNHATIYSETNSYLKYKIVSSGVYLGYIEIGVGSAGAAKGLDLTSSISNTDSDSTIVATYSANVSNAYIVSSNPYGYNITYAGKSSGKYSIRNPYILRGTTGHDTNSNSVGFFMGGSQSFVYSTQDSTGTGIYDITLMASGNSGDGSTADNIESIFGNEITTYSGKAYELILYKSGFDQMGSLIYNQRTHFSI